MDLNVMNKFKEHGVGTIARALSRLGYEAEKVAMEPRIKNFTPGLSMAGPAVTAKYRASRTKPNPEDYNVVNKVVNEAEKGCIFVLDGEQRSNTFFFGDIMANGLAAKGFVGAVIDGGIHDVPALKAMKFPSFSPVIGPRPSSNAMKPVAANISIQCGGVEVAPGDIIVGDDDGVVVCPKEKIDEVLKVADEIAKGEVEKIAKVKSGPFYV